LQGALQIMDDFYLGHVVITSCIKTQKTIGTRISGFVGVLASECLLHMVVTYQNRSGWCRRPLLLSGYLLLLLTRVQVFQLMDFIWCLKETVIKYLYIATFISSYCYHQVCGKYCQVWRVAWFVSCLDDSTTESLQFSDLGVWNFL